MSDETHPKFLQAQIDALRNEVHRDKDKTGIASGGPPHYIDPMDLRERLAKVESGLDWTKVILSIIASLMIGGFALLGVQISFLGSHISRIDSKIDAIPQRLSEEFRSMRSELSSQTSAIANAITATRQAQPQPTPPPVIVIPTPPPNSK